MRVGLMADTHDRLPAIAELLRQMQAAGVALLIHAGDYCAPFSLQPIEETSMSHAGRVRTNDGDREGAASGCQGRLRRQSCSSRRTASSSAGKRMLLVHDIGDVHQRSIECTRSSCMASRTSRR